MFAPSAAHVTIAVSDLTQKGHLPSAARLTGPAVSEYSARRSRDGCREWPHAVSPVAVCGQANEACFG